MAKTVTAKKRLGQHFLVDLTVAQNIADTVDVAPELPILEVGPGMGVLTRMLLEKKRTLKVVEIDEESGEPEVEIEFFDGDEEDSLDDITDSYWLINKANKMGGYDNITAIIIDNIDFDEKTKER